MTTVARVGRPDIVLLMTDQQRHEQIGYASDGFYETPALDALAARGVVFETAYSAAATCIPARVGLLTGMQPKRVPRHPASIFMGDAGSLFLGFLLAVIALRLRTGVGHFPSAVAAVLLVAPAVLDTTLVVISRVRSRRPIYVGGTDHSSHRLMLLGIGPRLVLAVLALATAFSASIGVLVSQALAHPVVGALVVFVPAALALVAPLRVGRYSPSSANRGQLVLAPP